MEPKSHNKKNVICNYFQKGFCKKGQNCNFSHVIEQKQSKFSGKQSSKICIYFINGTCKNLDCHFAHNIHKNLTHVAIQRIHDKSVAGIINVQNSFIAGYDDKIGIFDLNFNKKNELQVLGKVTKIVNFGNKVFCLTSNQSTSSSRVFISGENVDIPIDIKTAAVNDVLSIDKVIEINQNKLNVSIIFCAYENYIDIYPLINNKDLQAPSQLFSSDKSHIKTLAFYEENNLLLAGYSSGNIGTWELTVNNNFNLKSLDKLHEDAINKIAIFQKDFLITCSDDKSLKIYSLKTFSLILDQKCDQVYSNLTKGINNFLITKHLDNSFVFVLTMNNYELLAFKEMNNKFERFFHIPITEGSEVNIFLNQMKREVIEIDNPSRDNLTGNYLIISENGFLNINLWREAVNNEIVINEKKNKKNKDKSNKPDVFVKYMFQLN